MSEIEIYYVFLKYLCYNYNYNSVYYRETILLTQFRPYCLANFKGSGAEDFELSRWLGILLRYVKHLYSLENGQTQNLVFCR